MNKRQLIAFEARVADSWNKGEIRVPVHLSGGNENALIQIFDTINKEDYVFSTHRNHYHYLLKTGNAEGLLAEIMGRSEGICRGKSGSMHTIDCANRFYSSAIVAGCVAIAAGVGFAIKRRGGSEKVYCFVGDGATDEGWFWEAVRYVDGYGLPVRYFVEDNNRSVCTMKKERWGDEMVIPRSLGFYPCISYYRYTCKYPHVGTGKPIEW